MSAPDGATWRSGYATVCKSQAGSLGSPTSEILEALKVSGTSVIFVEIGVALIRYRSHFIAVTVAALPGIA